MLYVGTSIGLHRRYVMSTYIYREREAWMDGCMGIGAPREERRRRRKKRREERVCREEEKEGSWLRQRGLEAASHSILGRLEIEFSQEAWCLLNLHLTIHIRICMLNLSLSIDMSFLHGDTGISTYSTSPPPPRLSPVRLLPAIEI